MASFEPVARQSLPCKCCPGTAEIYGVVDFHRNCLRDQPDHLPLSGIPIYYHRCAACGFIFTAAFDEFTQDQFREHVYNAEYHKFDPDYSALRPEQNAKTILRLLGPEKSIRILDYGGGNGVLVAKLQEHGCTDVSCYDPFVPESSARPEGSFDLITCFEVVEHSPAPRQILQDIISLLKRPGMIIFSTMFQPADINKQQLDWWYVGPRNGHVSLFSRESMGILGESLGYRLGSFHDNLHVLTAEVPEFAKRFSPKD